MRFGAAELVTLAALLRDAAQREIMPRFRNLGAGRRAAQGRPARSGHRGGRGSREDASPRRSCGGFPGWGGRRGGDLGRPVMPRAAGRRRPRLRRRSGRRHRQLCRRPAALRRHGGSHRAGRGGGRSDPRPGHRRHCAGRPWRRSMVRGARRAPHRPACRARGAARADDGQRLVAVPCRTAAQPGLCQSPAPCWIVGPALCGATSTGWPPPATATCCSSTG